MKAVVIGAGIGGLAAAVRLRLKGYEVTVLEKSDAVGGKAQTLQLDGFRFDRGPSLFTMPHLVDELFIAAGRNPRSYFNFRRENESCRYFWPDGDTFLAPGSAREFAQAASAKWPNDAPRINSRINWMQRTYDRAAHIFLEKPLQKWSTWTSTPALRAMASSYRYGLLSTMHGANAQFQSPKLIQLFDRFATYNGSNPYRAPGILNVIPWLELGYGTYFPMGGMVSIGRAIADLAIELGVEIKTSTEVTRIQHKKGNVTAVQTTGYTHQAQVVVCNADVHFAYNQLLPDVKPPTWSLKREPSSSALVFYWGVNRQFPNFGLHNILFNDNYQEEFREIFDRGLVPDKPTVYLHISSKAEPEDAPTGCENWFVMVNAPAHKSHDWRALAEKLRPIVLNRLSQHAGTDVSQHLVAESQWNPLAIERDTLSYRGALYGTSSNSALAAFLRHPNKVSALKNLRFCGGSVHPGGGIPLVLNSARIACETLPNAR